MVGLYCRKTHAAIGLCQECRDLLDYSLERLDKCPFQEGKTTCAKCPLHCYQPAMRQKIRIVMRFSGLRMLSRHPILAILHLIEGRRKTPRRLN